jgi:hypothetical protein
MDKVHFIHIEFGIEGFIIIRTPKYEFILPPPERGACVNCDEETDMIELIKEITCIGNEITFVSNTKSYQFDISRLSKDEMNELWTTIDRMNFDKSIRISRKRK